MKKIMITIIAGTIASALITGCQQPAEGNIETATTTPGNKPMAGGPGGAKSPAPETNAPMEESGASAAGAAGTNLPADDKK